MNMKNRQSLHYRFWCHTYSTHAQCPFCTGGQCGSLAVENLHPDVNAVVELGGQDAKIIHFKEGKDGKKTVLTSMNDKCASGTGATIEKCTMKVGMENEDVQKLTFETDKLHHVAAKCGVFAETDIVNLVKTSVPSNEIMNSLADAIVMQNLTVLTRGKYPHAQSTFTWRA